MLACNAHLKQESDQLLDRMKQVGTDHPEYKKLKEKWFLVVEREWMNIAAITTREEREALLAGAEIEVAAAVERIKNG